MTIGSTSSAMVSDPARTAAAHLHRPHEDRQTQDTVDDRRHPREVGDMFVCIIRVNQLRGAYSSK